jgi:hypothetical protein
MLNPQRTPDGRKVPIKRVIAHPLQLVLLTIAVFLVPLTTIMVLMPARASAQTALPACTFPINSDYLTVAEAQATNINTATQTVSLSLFTDDGTGYNPAGNYLVLTLLPQHRQWYDNFTRIGLSNTGQYYGFHVGSNGSLTYDAAIYNNTVYGTTGKISCLTDNSDKSPTLWSDTNNGTPPTPEVQHAFPTAAGTHSYATFAAPPPPPPQSYAFPDCNLGGSLDAWAAYNYVSPAGYPHFMDPPTSDVRELIKQTMGASYTAPNTPYVIRQSDRQYAYPHSDMYDVYVTESAAPMSINQGPNGTIFLVSSGVIHHFYIVVSPLTPNSPDYQANGNNEHGGYGAYAVDQPMQYTTTLMGFEDTTALYTANTPVQLASTTHCMAVAYGTTYDASFNFAHFNDNATGAQGGTMGGAIDPTNPTSLKCTNFPIPDLVCWGKKLFVPSASVVKASIDGMQTTANAKFGVLLYPITFASTFFDHFVHPPPSFCNDTECHFSPGNFMGAPFTFDLGYMQHHIPTLWNVLINLFRVFVLVAFLFLIRRKYLGIMSR